MSTSTELVASLENAVMQLDHNKVSWINKHLVIDLQQKGQVLLESIARLENDEKEAAIEAAREFLSEIQPVLQELQTTPTGV